MFTNTFKDSIKHRTSIRVSNRLKSIYSIILNRDVSFRNLLDSMRAGLLIVRHPLARLVRPNLFFFNKTKYYKFTVTFNVLAAFAKWGCFQWFISFSIFRCRRTTTRYWIPLSFGRAIGRHSTTANSWHRRMCQMYKSTILILSDISSWRIFATAEKNSLLERKRSTGTHRWLEREIPGYQREHKRWR